MADIKYVFALRKAGQTDEAYDLACHLWALHPGDAWVKRGLGWVLYDKLKQALADGNQELIDRWCNELQQLEISSDDEMLYENVSRLMAARHPAERLFSEAVGLDFNGEPEKALPIFRKLAAENFSNPRFGNAYGWCLWKNAAKVDHKASGADIALQKIAGEYLGLNNDRPSELHSLMLGVILKAAPANPQRFSELFGKWGWQNLRDEDFQPFTYNDRQYPGVAVRAIQLAAKWVLPHGSAQQADAFLHLLGRAITSDPANIWLYYYKAKLLVRLNRPAEALAFMLPVLRQKQTEFWTWALLADIYAGMDDGRETAIALYCMALSCRAEEKYLFNTRWNFARLLEKAGYFNEARTEIELSLEARKRYGYSIPTDYEAVAAEDWYRQARPVNNKAFYSRFVPLAREVVFGAMPQARGIFIGTFTRKDDPREILRAKMLFAIDGQQLQQVSVRVAKYPVLKACRKGDGLFGRLDTTVPQKPRVLEITNRDQEMPYDLLPETVGVVTFNNKEKMLTSVLLPGGGVVLLRGKSAYNPGCFVALRVLEQPREGRVYSHVVWHAPTTAQPDASICTTFEGKFTLNPKRKGSGAVGNIVLMPWLVSAMKLQNSDQVSGVAAFFAPKGDDRAVWQALTITRVKQV